MMNDRFDANLRQHLLGTADERPADGQLDAVLRSVAGTAQRAPLAARLNWYPGRIGRFETRTLRLGLVAGLLVIGSIVGAMLIGSSSSSVFEGTWRSTDSGDGSNQSLVIGAGPAPDVRFVDHYATGKACRNDAVKVFTADGTGTVDGDRLTVVFPDGGGCGLEAVPVVLGVITYRAASDTITDGNGLVWSRLVGDFAPPTRGPVDAAETPPPGNCFEVPPGDAYRNDVGPLSLKVTIPLDARSMWEGYRGGFEVARSCLFGRPVLLAASIVFEILADCDPSSVVEASTHAEAVAALGKARGITVSAPASVTLGGYPAARFDIASDAQMCFDEVLLWGDTSIARGSAMIIYLVDVDGVTLGLSILNRDGGGSPAEVAEAEAIFGSIDIAQRTDMPEPSALSTPGVPDGCLQFNSGGTYTAPAGPWSLTTTIPNTPGTWWHGLASYFFLSRSPCLFGAPLVIEAEPVTGVPADACAWSSTVTDTSSAAEAATLMASQRGPSVDGPTELTIGGFTAFRLDLSLPGEFDTTTCDNGVVVVAMTNDGPFTNMDPGALTFHLVDVDGMILGVRVVGGVDEDIPTLGAEIEQIIGSLEITVPGGAGS